MEPAEAARSIAPRAAKLAARNRERPPAPGRAGLLDLGRRPLPDARPRRRRRGRGRAGASWSTRSSSSPAATARPDGASRSPRPAGCSAPTSPRDAAQEMFGDEASVFGGVFAPMGRAVAGPRDGGTSRSRAAGASAAAVQHCDWLMGGCLVEEGGGLRKLESGAPDIRFMLFPASEAEVIDTWNVAGLRGTGSHDFAVDGATVPEERSASLITDSPRCDGPALRLPGLRPAGALDRLGRARHRPCRDRRPGRARDREEALGLDADARPALGHPVGGRGGRGPGALGSRSDRRGRRRGVGRGARHRAR